MDVLEFPALEESSTVKFFHDRAELSAQDFFGRPRPDLAPDLAQDGLLKAHIQLSSGGRIDHPGAWLRTMYKNRLIDLWRSERSRPEHVSISSLRSLFADPEVSAMALDITDPGSETVSEDRIRVSEALDEVCGRLTPRQQKIFEYGLEGLSQREIAELLEISPALISSEVRAIEHVIRELWPPDDGGGGSGGGSAGTSTWIKRLHGTPSRRNTNYGGGTMGHLFDPAILRSELPELGRLLCELPVFEHDDGLAARTAAGRPAHLADIVAHWAPATGAEGDEEPDQREGGPMPIWIGLGGTGCRVVRLVSELLERHIPIGNRTEDDDECGGPATARGGPPVVVYDHLGHLVPGELAEKVAQAARRKLDDDGFVMIKVNAEPFEDPGAGEDDLDRIWTEIHATVTDFLAACRWIDAGELDVFSSDHLEVLDAVELIHIGEPGRGAPRSAQIQAILGALQRAGQDGDDGDGESLTVRTRRNPADVDEEMVPDRQRHLARVVTLGPKGCGSRVHVDHGDTLLVPYAGELVHGIGGVLVIDIGELSDGIPNLHVREVDDPVPVADGGGKGPGWGVLRAEQIEAVLGALRRIEDDGDGDDPDGPVTAVVTGDGLAVLSRRAATAGTDDAVDTLVLVIPADREVLH